MRDNEQFQHPATGISKNRYGQATNQLKVNMKYLFLLPTLLIITISCGPRFKSTITSKQQPLSENDIVLVLQKDGPFDEEGIEIGTMKAGDSGFSSNCSYNEVIGTLTKTAKLNGANIVKIIEHKTADLISTCDRITAKIYRVADIRKYENEIDWSSTRKLSWDDFKGKPTSTSNNNVAATTYCGFSFESNRISIFKKVKIYTKTTFDCKLSWVRPDQKGRVDLLEHEQTHFDLCEVYARILRKKIEEKKLTVFNLNDANNLFKEVYASYLERQALYDQETNYGLDRQRQIEWTMKVGHELNELSQYL